MLEINENEVCAEEEAILLSIKEASGLAGVAKDTIRRALKQGILQGVLHNGKYGKEYKIYKNSFEKWLGKRIVPAYGFAEGQVLGVGVAPAENAYGQKEQKGCAEGLKEDSAYRYATVPFDILNRFEQAMHRAGWLEGQLEMTKKLLTEGQETIRQREESLIREKIEIEERLKQEKEEKENLAQEILKIKNESEVAVQKQNEIIVEEKEKTEQLKKEKEELTRILLFKNTPWWKKIFYTKEQLEKKIEKEQNDENQRREK